MLRSQANENEQVLDEKQATKFRSAAARCNYLSTDRPDIMYAVKEVCREMSKPTRGAWKKLKRIGRYLVGKPRTVLRYDWQGREDEMDGFTDSDWAGCRRTGKSTSGGAIMIGGHFIKGWSRTQNHVTMSSAEAERIALVKCTSECMGIQSMFRDWGCNMKCNLYADSSAALAIAKRKGAGKLRNINVSALWIQDVQDREGAEYMKVLGTENPADLMTKYLTREKIDNAVDRMSQVLQEGRAKSSLDIQGQDIKDQKPKVQNSEVRALSRQGEDYREITGKAVSIIHVLPRKALFVPKGAIGGVPSPAMKYEHFGPIRITNGRDDQCDRFVYRDYWQVPRRRGSDRELPVRWWGTTTFVHRDEYRIGSA